MAKEVFDSGLSRAYLWQLIAYQLEENDLIGAYEIVNPLHGNKDKHQMYEILAFCSFYEKAFIEGDFLEISKKIKEFKDDFAFLILCGSLLNLKWMKVNYETGISTENILENKYSVPSNRSF